MKRKRKRYGPDRIKIIEKIISLANLSSSKQSKGYLTKTQLIELQAFLIEVRNNNAK